LASVIAGALLVAAIPRPAPASPPISRAGYVQSVTAWVRILELQTNSLGSGSGTIWRCGSRVVVITAGHCVLDGETITLRVEIQGREFPVKVLAVNRERDIAFLEVEAFPTWPRYCHISNTNRLAPGTVVVHVGNMLGDFIKGGYSEGRMIQNGVKAPDSEWPWKNPLEAATLHAMPGCSGGGVFDERGYFVGVLVGVHPQYLTAFFIPVCDVIAAAREGHLDFFFR
jgi:S1-C subfamily serine protease